MINYVDTEYVCYEDNINDCVSSYSIVPDNDAGIMTIVLDHNIGGGSYEFYIADLFPNGELKNDAFYVNCLNSSMVLKFVVKSVVSEYQTTENLGDYFNNLYGTSAIHFGVSSDIYECYIEHIENNSGVTLESYEANESYKLFGSSPYVKYRAMNVFGTYEYGGYFSIPSEYMPTDYKAPYIGSAVINGSDIFWLYNLGDFLFGSSSTLNKLLDLSIGDTNLITLLFGSGFLLYAGWCIIKWVIPV